MAEVNKINEKQVVSVESTDIDKVKKFRNDFAELTARMGEIEVELLNAEMITGNIKEAKLELASKYKTLRGEEVTLTNDFKEKYGNGEFNIEEATFTPEA
tara:strand:+ start:1643 stop:1942 length:300 start_codon:yes stop_codon:yes gene_type:complete